MSDSHSLICPEIFELNVRNAIIFTSLMYTIFLTGFWDCYFFINILDQGSCTSYFKRPSTVLETWHQGYTRLQQNISWWRCWGNSETVCGLMLLDLPTFVSSEILLLCLMLLPFNVDAYHMISLLCFFITGMILKTYFSHSNFLNAFRLAGYILLYIRSITNLESDLCIIFGLLLEEFTHSWIWQWEYSTWTLPTQGRWKWCSRVFAKYCHENWSRVRWPMY